jgi:hypothetical protein
LAEGIARGHFLFKLSHIMKNYQPQGEVLHLNEKMIVDLIGKVENSIFENSIKMEAIAGPLKEAEDKYLPLKKQYTVLETANAEDQKTLAVLIGYRDNKNLRKEIRVHRSLTNATPVKPRRERLPLQPAAIQVLNNEKRFLSPETLVNKILELNPAWKPRFPNKGDINKVIENMKLSVKRDNPKLVLYNDKFGLPSWMSNGSVKPEYLQSVLKAI